MSEMRRKLEAVEQAVSSLDSSIVSNCEYNERVTEDLNALRKKVASAIDTCAREDKARHVRQQRGGSDE